ncbi:hypothetical protein FXO38_18639 [Capsicum annuum]|nr:hypothetical protein FXO38_18639 [Capsicum annuum]
MGFGEMAKKVEMAWRQKSRALWLKYGDNTTKFFHKSANAHRRFNNIDLLETDGEPSPFEAQEIWANVLCSFSVAFFKHSWEVVNTEVIVTIQNFHERGIFERSFNATSVALIPRKVGAKELKDFRPISLIGSIYKIISKLLTERLKKVMHKLVDDKQMAFLIAKECINSRIKDKEPEKWVSWIHYCINTTKFSVLVNVSPAGFFSSQRGWTKARGSTIPFFVNHCHGETKYDMMKTAQSNSWIIDFRVDSRAVNNLEITHLQYVDDTLVFCGADKGQIRFLRVIFILFELLSRLHINWNKSFLYPVNEVLDIHNVSNILGGRIGMLPTIYLGMPRGAKSNSKDIWNGVPEKCLPQMKVIAEKYDMDGEWTTKAVTTHYTLQKHKEGWTIVPACIWWIILKERNQRYAQTVPTRQIFVEMQRDRSLQQQNADAYDCSNFVDLDWLSSSGNSCEEEFLDRSLFMNSPIGGPSSENVVSDIVGERTPVSSEGGCSMNVGISVTSQGTENAGAEASYSDAQSCVVVEELSDSFARWVNFGETLCH